jgi:hypothetical protein
VRACVWHKTHLIIFQYGTHTGAAVIRVHIYECVILTAGRERERAASISIFCYILRERSKNTHAVRLRGVCREVRWMRITLPRSGFDNYFAWCSFRTLFVLPLGGLCASTPYINEMHIFIYMPLIFHTWHTP